MKPKTRLSLSRSRACSCVKNTYDNTCMTLWRKILISGNQSRYLLFANKVYSFNSIVKVNNVTRKCLNSTQYLSDILCHRIENDYRLVVSKLSLCDCRAIAWDVFRYYDNRISLFLFQRDQHISGQPVSGGLTGYAVLHACADRQICHAAVVLWRDHVQSCQLFAR